MSKPDGMKQTGLEKVGRRALCVCLALKVADKQTVGLNPGVGEPARSRHMCQLVISVGPPRLRAELVGGLLADCACYLAIQACCTTLTD